MAGFLSLSGAPAYSVGPFTDLSRVSDFVTAPHGPGVTGSITRADCQGRGAAVFDLAWFFPVRDSFLFQLESSYITVDAGDDIVEGFGDAFLWSKARVWRGQRKALFITSCVRFGIGAPAYFPYATASTDVGVGVAFTDSLGLGDEAGGARRSKYLAYWINAGGTYVLRLNDSLEESELHGNHAAAAGGIHFRVARAFGIEAGAMGLFFDSGALRELYYSRVTVQLAPPADLYVTVQGERGDWRERATDASAQVGLTVRY